MKQNVIAIAIDRDMFPPAAFLADRLATLNPRDDTTIAILSDSEEDLEKARKFGVAAELIFAKLPLELEGQPTDRITVASFLRLFIPDFVADSTRRILYLDADIYLENDRIFRLFDLEMCGLAVAAVRDIRLVYTAAQKYLAAELAKARVPAERYLNGGLLLIDRSKFHDSKIGTRTLKTAARRYLRHDLALNRILAGKWMELSPAMNAPMDLREALVSNGWVPNVTHFIGTTKPWHGPRFASEHPARKETEEYILRSPWRDFLSRHYSFRTAWDTIQSKHGGPTFAAPPKPTTFKQSARADLEGINAYLRNTEFADIRQGITELPTLQPE